MAVLRTGVVVAAVLIPVQILVGDMHGLNTLKHQPAKLAAMEGIWETQKGAAAVLFAVPDRASQSNLYEVSIPRLASFYLTHDWNGEIKGIKEFGDKHPPVGPVFWAFRTMVGVGLLMLAVSWFASYEMKFKKGLSRTTAKILVAMTFAGWVALVSGWSVTEIGRQPSGGFTSFMVTEKFGLFGLLSSLIISMILKFLYLFLRISTSESGVALCIKCFFEEVSSRSSISQSFMFSSMLART
jgi:cytochrome bd-type quinol oxidase subunit 1